VLAEWDLTPLEPRSDVGEGPRVSELPHISPRAIGRTPAVIVNVKFPRDFRVADFAALFARAGRLKWIRRGKALQVER
jgi:hypothetical protein